MRTVELRSERLLLDALGSADAAAVAEYCADDELQRFVPVPVPYGVEQAEAFVGEHAAEVASSEGGMLWAIRPLDEPGLMGVIELIAGGDRTAEVGFWMGAPHRGRGFMAEALRRVVSFSFDELQPPLHRLVWRGYLENAGSATVARRAGFRYEGIERGSSDHRGAWVDMHRAAILASDSRDEVRAWP